MKRVLLTQGYYAIVDDENYEWLSAYKWRLFSKKTHNLCYAVAQKDGETVFMHRLILGLEKGDGVMTDHKNGNGLDNRNCNIRPCTNSQNQHNSKLKKDNKSGYKGVSWFKRGKKWRACIKIKGKRKSLGCFAKKIDAARAYNKVAIKLFGEFAKLNVIKEQGV